MQSKNKKLDDYFKAAKLQEPAVSLEELQGQLQHAGVSSGGSAGQGAATLWAKTLPLLFMGMFGTALTATLLWSGIEEEQLVQTEQLIVQTEQPLEKKITRQEEQIPLPLKDEIAIAATDTITAKAVAPTTGTGKKQASLAAPTPSTKVQGRPASAPIRPLPPSPVRSGTHKASRHNEAAAASGQSASLLQNQVSPVFANIKLVELPKEALEKLQIQVSEAGIFYKSVLEDATNEEGKNTILKVEVTNNVHHITLGSVAHAPTATFLPVFISERSGKQRVAYRLPTETKRKFERAYFNEMINSLVPVLVKANNATQDEVIFWFEPTPAFLGLLPLTVSTEINEEYKHLLENRDATRQLAKADSTYQQGGKVKTPPAQEAGKGVATEALLNTSYKYFESGVSNLTTIKYAVVYPNPAREYVKLTIGLKRDETLRVSLVDINGKLVKVLSPYKPYSVGSVTEEFNIQGTLPGLYLIVTETRSGSRLSQRIIIQ